MEERCDEHAFEMAEDVCRECGRAYCHECLVYAFGPNKPPMCVACAIAAAGIRKHAGRPKAVSRRELRKREKERKRSAKRGRTDAEPVEVKAIDVEEALATDGRAEDNVPVGTPF